MQWSEEGEGRAMVRKDLEVRIGDARLATVGLPHSSIHLIPCTDTVCGELGSWFVCLVSRISSEDKEVDVPVAAVGTLFG